MFATMITGFLAFLAQVLGAKVAMVAVVLSVVTGVILAVKAAITAIISSIPYSPLPAEVLSTASQLLPENFGTVIELMINARILLLIYDSKWMYLRTVMSLMSMKML